MKLASATWPQLVAVAPTSILVVPLGSTEQHGPHLPLSTDTDIAITLAERLAAVRDDVVVAPALAYGSSGEHAGFPGTLSIGQDALEHVVIELVRSADDFAGVLLLSGHGGNAAPLRRAVESLRAEGRLVTAWAPAGYRDAHAGHSETSILLALDPSLVRLDAAAPGNTRPLADLLPMLRARGVHAVARGGVLGDPTGASAEEGRSLLDELVADLVTAVDRMVADA